MACGRRQKGDRAQLANMASQAKAVLGRDELEVVADRGYYSGREIRTCEQANLVIFWPRCGTTGIGG
jgi:hypothetical protein